MPAAKRATISSGNLFLLKKVDPTLGARYNQAASSKTDVLCSSLQHDFAATDTNLYGASVCMYLPSFSTDRNPGNGVRTSGKQSYRECTLLGISYQDLHHVALHYPDAPRFQTCENELRHAGAQQCSNRAALSPGHRPGGPIPLHVEEPSS